MPISKLAKCIVNTQVDITESNILAPILGHVGDGIFFLTIVIDLNNTNELERAKALNERLVKRALDFGGTCTGEHGVGKLHFMQSEQYDANHQTSYRPR